jgi:hypothetical protein
MSHKVLYRTQQIQQLCRAQYDHVHNLLHLCNGYRTELVTVNVGEIVQVCKCNVGMNNSNSGGGLTRRTRW